MKRYNLLLAALLVAVQLPLSGAAALDNAAGYAQAARTSLDAGYVETAISYADTALAYCTSLSDAWYLKALAETRQDALLPLTATVETLEHAFDGGSFWLDESEYDARMWLADLCYTTGRYQRAAELLAEDEAVTEEKLLLLSRIWYKLGDKESARGCIETGIQMYPDDTEFYCIYFRKEKPEDVMGTSLCDRLIANVSLFDPAASDIYLFASDFVDEKTSVRYMMMYGLYNASHPLYPVYALEKGLMPFNEALYTFDSLCHDGMMYGQFSWLCSLAKEEDLVYLYAFLDEFNGVILFKSKGSGLPELTCSYRYGRPYTVSYDRDCDNFIDMYVTCDYGTPETVSIPAMKATVEYNRYPSVIRSEFAEPSITLDFARNACSWKAVTMEKAAFSTDDFAFYIPSLADPLEDVTPASFCAGCSSIECTTDDPSGCAIRITMNGGKPVDAFYTVRGKLYARAYFKDGRLLYRDVDMDGDGLYELCEQYQYDDPEPDEELIGNRLYGTVADCFEIPRFSVLLSDSDGDGFYEYEETLNPDGTSEKVWY